MKFTIMGFDQAQALQMGLDLTDLLLLSWLKDFYHSMDKVIVNNKQYAWVSYKYLLNDIPIIGIGNRRSLARRFDKLCEKNLVEKYISYLKDNTKGKYTYFAITEETIGLLTNEVSRDSKVRTLRTPEYVPSVLESTYPTDSKVQSKINLLEDKSTIDTSTIDKEKEEKTAFGEFENVLLTREEVDKLYELYNESYEDLARAIDILDEYIENSPKGRKYKNHYAVLRKNNWVYKRVYEEKQTAPIKRGGLYWITEKGYSY